MATPNNADNVSLMRQVRLSVDSLNNNLTTPKPHLSFETAGISGDTYILWVDLDNSLGLYPHVKTRSICIDHLKITTTFTGGGAAEMATRFGVITAITPSDCSIDYHINHKMGSQGGSTAEPQTFLTNYPSDVHFETDAAGNSVGAVTNVKASETAVNSTDPLESPAGLIVPSVGDVIMKLEYVADDFDINVDCIYHTN